MRPSVVTTRPLKQNYLNTQHRLRITIYQFCLKFNDICSIITIQPVKSLVHCKIKSMLLDIKALRKGSMCGLYFALLQSISLLIFILYQVSLFRFSSFSFNGVTSNRQSKWKVKESAWLKWRHFICRVCVSTVSESYRKCHQLERNFLASLQFLEWKRKTHIFQMMMILLIFNDSF